MYSEMVTLCKLILVLPASNAISERSFSGLKLVKTYLRNSMGQERLNHLLFLHLYKKEVDSLSIDSIVREFVEAKDGRKNFFKI